MTSAMWNYASMWFGCMQNPVDWSFPYGTLVSADSYEEALDLLHKYKLSYGKAVATQIEQGRWTVQFDYAIYVTVEAKDSAQAIQRASWKFYMDKREAKSPEARWQA